MATISIKLQLQDPCLAVENKNSIDRLYFEASKVVMPLFKKLGFELESINTINLRGQLLTNYNMSAGTRP